jgi:cold shock CspA family protein
MAVDPPRLGVVAAFDADRGLGTVRGEDGREWSFHCARISDGSRSVEVGQAVAFIVGPGAPGQWEAVSVVKAQPAPPPGG